jgi:hypothetical protein
MSRSEINVSKSLPWDEETIENNGRSVVLHLSAGHELRPLLELMKAWMEAASYSPSD